MSISNWMSSAEGAVMPSSPSSSLRSGAVPLGGAEASPSVFVTLVSSGAADSGDESSGSVLPAATTPAGTDSAVSASTPWTSA